MKQLLLVIAILLSLASCQSKRDVPYRLQCTGFDNVDFGRTRVDNLDSSYKIGDMPQMYGQQWTIISREK